jgi:hypothetical protein
MIAGWNARDFGVFGWKYLEMYLSIAVFLSSLEKVGLPAQPVCKQIHSKSLLGKLYLTFADLLRNCRSAVEVGTLLPAAWAARIVA